MIWVISAGAGQMLIINALIVAHFHFQESRGGQIIAALCDHSAITVIWKAIQGSCSFQRLAKQKTIIDNN